MGLVIGFISVLLNYSDYEVCTITVVSESASR